MCDPYEKVHRKLPRFKASRQSRNIVRTTRTPPSVQDIQVWLASFVCIIRHGDNFRIIFDRCLLSVSHANRFSCKSFLNGYNKRQLTGFWPRPECRKEINGHRRLLLCDIKTENCCQRLFSAEIIMLSLTLYFAGFQEVST